MPSQLEEIVIENARARGELLEAVQAVPPERRTERAIGEWSAKDVLAHLAAWQEAYAHGLEMIARGERPELPGYEGDDDAFNAKNVEAASEQSWEEIVARLDAARERHEAAVRALSELDPDRYAPGRTAHRFATSGSHEREHIPELLAWRKEQGL